MPGKSTSGSGQSSGDSSKPSRSSQSQWYADSDDSDGNDDAPSNMRRSQSMNISSGVTSRQRASSLPDSIPAAKPIPSFVPGG